MGLGEQLSEFLDATAAAAIRVAAIGGVAVNVHGYVRGTHDLDFLVGHADVERLAHLLGSLGYVPIDQRPDLSSWVRGQERVDLLHARRPHACAALASARDHAYAGSVLPTIDVETLMGFKIQAYSNDPRRLRDLSDIAELLAIHHGKIDLPRVREYFRLFDQEPLFDDLLTQTNP